MQHHKLPTELYDQIARDLGRASLINFGRAASLTYHIALRRIYRKIVMPPKTPRNIVVAMLRAVEGNALIMPLVIHMELAWSGRQDESGPVAAMLLTVLPRLPNLEHLSISTAIGIYTWAFDDITMPSLRELHIWSDDGRLESQFLQRHPNLRQITVPSNIGPGRGSIEDFASRGLMELESLCVLHLTALQKVLKLNTMDSPPRLPKLTRLDIGWNISQLIKPIDRLEQCLPALARINHISPLAGTSTNNSVWPNVVRFGLVACISQFKPYDRDGRFRRLVARILTGYPNVHTLDLICRNNPNDRCLAKLQDPDLVKRDFLEHLEPITKLRMITMPGLAYTRKSPDDKFSRRPLVREDDAPSIPWHLLDRETVQPVSWCRFGRYLFICD